MTPERRQEILSSDVLGIKELGELLDLKYDKAAQKMRDIKRGSSMNGGDKLDLQGKILIQDYINYSKLDISRYTPTVELAASANANAKE